MLGIFLDTETNGLNARKHRVIELAYKIIDVQTGVLIEEFQSIVLQSPEAWRESDPTSLQINGFTWELVSTGRSEGDIAEQIIVSFKKHAIKRGNAVFICQNPSFDRAFFSQLIDTDVQEKLGWPYHWLDLASMYWAKSLAQKKPEHLPWITGFSKDRIAAAYSLAPENKPHRAMNGVDHLILCYRAVVGFA